MQLSDRSWIDFLEYRRERVVDRKFLNGDDPISASGELHRPLGTQAVLMCRLGWLRVARPSCDLRALSGNAIA